MDESAVLGGDAYPFEADVPNTLGNPKAMQQPIDGAGELTLARDGITCVHVSSTSRDSETIESVAFSAGGLALATGTRGGLVRVWQSTGNTTDEDMMGQGSASPYAPTQTLVAHRGRVWALAFSPSSSTLVSGGWDGRVIVWNWREGTKNMVLDKHTAPVWSVVFSVTGVLLLSSSMDGYVMVWAASSGHHLATLGTGPQHRCACVAIAPTDDIIADGGLNHAVRFWSADEGSSLRTRLDHIKRLEAARERREFQQREGQVSVRKTRQSHHRRKLAFLGVAQEQGDADEEELERFGSPEVEDEPTATCVEHTGAVTSLIFSPDGKMLASGSHDGTVVLWDAVTHTLLRRLHSNSGSAVWSVAFSKDSRLLAMAEGPGLLDLWDPSDGNLLMSVGASQRDIIACAFSFDGNLLATAAQDGTLRLWQLYAPDRLLALRNRIREERERRKRELEEAERLAREAREREEMPSSGPSTDAAEEVTPPRARLRQDEWDEPDWSPTERDGRTQLGMQRRDGGIPTFDEIDELTGMTERELSRLQALKSLVLVRHRDRQRQNNNVEALRQHLHDEQSELDRLRRQAISRLASVQARKKHGLPTAGTGAPNPELEHLDRIHGRLKQLYNKLDRHPKGDTWSFVHVAELHPEDLERQHQMEKLMLQSRPFRKYSLQSAYY